jgi:hypothetical protein
MAPIPLLTVPDPLVKVAVRVELVPLVMMGLAAVNWEMTGSGMGAGDDPPPPPQETSPRDRHNPKAEMNDCGDIVERIAWLQGTVMRLGEVNRATLVSIVDELIVSLMILMYKSIFYKLLIYHVY